MTISEWIGAGVPLLIVARPLVNAAAIVVVRLAGAKTVGEAARALDVARGRHGVEPLKAKPSDSS